MIWMLTIYYWWFAVFAFQVDLEHIGYAAANQNYLLIVSIVKFWWWESLKLLEVDHHYEVSKLKDVDLCLLMRHTSNPGWRTHCRSHCNGQVDIFRLSLSHCQTLSISYPMIQLQCISLLMSILRYGSPPSSHILFSCSYLQTLKQSLMSTTLLPIKYTLT